MKMSHQGLKKFHGQSQSLLESLWPATVTIGGTDYKAACVGERSAGSLENGGYVDDVDLVIRVSKTVLPQRPADGTLLIYNGKRYRIQRVPLLLEPAWTIQCMTASE